MVNFGCSTVFDVKHQGVTDILVIGEVAESLIVSDWSGGCKIFL